MGTAYNPLDKRNLGKSVVQALLARPTAPLDELTPFEGAGVYAVYYSGAFPAYAALSAKNRKAATHPIYVGKAVPSGARKGGIDDTAPIGRPLCNRLSEHAKTITEVTNLELKDFTCRHLAVDDIWIPLGESLLIQEFAPLWNLVVEGFGNHDPGSGRTAGKRPVWDMIHPGRAWAVNHPEQPVAKMAEVHSAITEAMKKLK